MYLVRSFLTGLLALSALALLIGFILAIGAGTALFVAFMGACGAIVVTVVGMLIRILVFDDYA